MRRVAGRLRLDLAQYRSLVSFAQFGTADLDAATRRQLERGQRMTDVLKQPQYRPPSLPQQVTILYAVVNGHMDDVPLDKVAAFEEGFHRFMGSAHPEVLQKIVQTNDLDAATEQALQGAVTEFKQRVAY